MRIIDEEGLIDFGFAVDAMDSESKKDQRIIELEDIISSILCKEEEGHRFSSDDTLAEIFNECRSVKSK